MNIRAKFKLTEHRCSSWNGIDFSHEFVFQAHYDDTIPEDRRFATATPSGQMVIRVDNPPVVEYWGSQLGKCFYLDFTPADGA